MWNFFEDGTFYSAVVDREDASLMVVRTRDRRSIDSLATFMPGLEVLEIKGDYRFRVWIAREEWQAFVDEHIQNARATNFKSEVAKNVGHEEGGRIVLDALHDIWSVMFDLQSKMRGLEARGRKAKRFEQKLKRGYSSGLATLSSEVPMSDEEWQDYLAWAERNGKPW